MKEYINYRVYTDVTPYEVLSSNESGSRIVVREMIAKRIDKNGMSDAQTYEYTSSEGPELKMSLRKNGAYQFVGQATASRGCCGALADAPHKYYDFSF